MDLILKDAHHKDINDAVQRQELIEDIEELLKLGLIPTLRTFELANNYEMPEVSNSLILYGGRDLLNTELHQAVIANDDVTVVKLLKQYTKEGKAKTNSFNQTPFDLVIHYNRRNLLPVFSKYYDFLPTSSESTPLYAALNYIIMDLHPI